MHFLRHFALQWALHCRFCCCDMEETYRYELCASVFLLQRLPRLLFAILFAAPKKELIFAVFRAGLPGWFILFCTGSRGNVVFGQSGGNLCFDNFKSYSGSSKMQSCHDLSGIRDFSTGSGSRYLLYGILSDIRNAGKMLGKRAGNFSRLPWPLYLGLFLAFSIPETLFHKKETVSNGKGLYG